MKPLNQWTPQDILAIAKSVDKKTWGMIAGGIVGAAVLWFLLIGPAWIERPILRQKIQEMDAQMRQYESLKPKRLDLEKEQAESLKLFEDTKARLYKEGDIALILGQIAKLANEARVDLVASKPKSAETPFPAPYDSRYQPVSYDFTMQGGYHQLGALAAAIESFSRMIRIQKIRIIPDPQNAGKHLADLSLMAVAEKITVPAPVTDKAAAKKTKKKKK